MYVRSEPRPTAFDAVMAVEGQFKYRPDLDAAPTVEVTMVYLNSETMETFGPCPVKKFSPRTMEALMEFLRCAEHDFGDRVFMGGETTPYGPLATPSARAESEEGLPRGLGEKR